MAGTLCEVTRGGGESDLLVSLVTLPLGYGLVGPMSALLGTAGTLCSPLPVALGSSLALLLVPSVRGLRDGPQPRSARSLAEPAPG